MNSCDRKCRPEALCPKCSLVEVIRFRFGAFRQKFNQIWPDEPLFFDPAQECPEKACIDETRGHIEAAAAAMGVRLRPVLHLLNLDSGHSEVKPSVKTGSQSQRRPQRSAWERFVSDGELHRAHNITAAELGMLSQVAMMGEARASRDFLFMLDTIWQTNRQ